LKTTYRDYDWWAYFFRVRQRRLMDGIKEYDRLLGEFVWRVLDLREGDEVLDAGCGGGTQAAELARLGAKVTGIDFAPSLIRYAKELIRFSNFDVDFRLGDLMELDETGRYDAVCLLSTTFGQLDDGPAFLPIAFKALKGGGKLIIEDVNPSVYGVNIESVRFKVEKDNLTLSTRYDPDTMVLENRFYVDDEYGRRIRLERDESTPDETVNLYNPESVTRIVESAGFVVDEILGDVAPVDVPATEKSPKIITVAHKKC